MELSKQRARTPCLCDLLPPLLHAPSRLTKANQRRSLHRPGLYKFDPQACMLQMPQRLKLSSACPSSHSCLACRARRCTCVLTLDLSTTTLDFPRPYDSARRQLDGYWQMFMTTSTTCINAAQSRLKGTKFNNKNISESAV